MSTACNVWWLRFSLVVFLGAANARAVDPAEWIRGIGFALPVTCEWGGTLATEPEATQRLYLQALQRALAIAVRHLPTRPPENIFSWPGAATNLKHRDVVIVLTNRRPAIDGEELPAAVVDPLIALTVPVTNGTRERFYVFLKLDRFLFEEPGKLAPEAFGGTLTAFGHSIVSALPYFLARSSAELEAFRRSSAGSKIAIQREGEISQRAHEFMTAVLSDERAGLTYNDRLKVYWGMQEHRRRIQNARGGLAMTAKQPFAVKFGYEIQAPPLTPVPADARADFGAQLMHALGIVGEHPPDGDWNNFFTWDPATVGNLGWKQCQLTALYGGAEIVPAMWAARAGQSNPVPVDASWGGTTSGGTFSPKQHVFLVDLILRSILIDDQRRLRPDRLPWMVSFFGGEIYAHMHRELKWEIEDMRRNAATAISEHSSLVFDLRSRRAAIATLERVIAGPYFRKLDLVMQGHFRAVLDQTRGICAIIDRCMRGAATPNN